MKKRLGARAGRAANEPGKHSEEGEDVSLAGPTRSIEVKISREKNRHSGDGSYDEVVELRDGVRLCPEPVQAAVL